jgi:thiosulfate/3-mercaptopyruvate sulfurtransferase
VIHGGPPARNPGQKLAVYEVANEGQAAYAAGHIPGAVYLDTNALEAPPLWNRLPDRELEAALLAHGVSHDTPVVLYGRDTRAAARAAVIMMYCGAGDVRLLDGGYQAWTSTGYEVETGTRQPVPVTSFGRQVPAHPEYIIDIEEVRAILAGDDAALVSIRTWAEYTGQISGYDRLEARGRIAGARWGHAGSTPDQMDHFRREDNTMRSPGEIEANWRAWGITSEKRVAFYCGTGWRASEAFFYAYAMGWDRISVYDGGWSEWSADPANPVETGDPTHKAPGASGGSLHLDFITRPASLPARASAAAAGRPSSSLQSPSPRTR